MGSEPFCAWISSGGPPQSFGRYATVFYGFPGIALHWHPFLGGLRTTTQVVAGKLISNMDYAPIPFVPYTVRLHFPGGNGGGWYDLAYEQANWT